MVINPFNKASFAGGFPWHRGFPLTSQEVVVSVDDILKENIFGDYIVGTGACRKISCSKPCL